MTHKPAKNELLEVIAWFKEHFPNAFPSKRSDIKPLQLGIMDDILDFYDRLDNPPFSKKKLRAGLNYYTSSPAYLLAQKEGCPRVDVFGFDADVVTRDQSEYAQQRLTQHRETKQKKMTPPTSK